MTYNNTLFVNAFLLFLQQAVHIAIIVLQKVKHRSHPVP